LAARLSAQPPAAPAPTSTDSQNGPSAASTATALSATPFAGLLASANPAVTSQGPASASASSGSTDTDAADDLGQTGDAVDQTDGSPTGQTAAQTLKTLASGAPQPAPVKAQTPAPTTPSAGSTSSPAAGQTGAQNAATPIPNTAFADPDAFSQTPLSQGAADGGLAQTTPLSQAPAKSLASAASSSGGASTVKTSTHGSSSASGPAASAVGQASATLTRDAVQAVGQGASQDQDQVQDGGQGQAGAAIVQADAAAAPQAQTPLQPDAATLAATSAQAQASSTATASAQATPDVRTVSELSARIIQTASGGKSSFEMTLHPEGLGDVRVKVSVDRNGAVSANMTFSDPAAAASLGARVDDLKHALNQAGFTVADNGLNFNMNGQDQSGSGQNAWTSANPNAGRAFQNAAGASEDLLASVSQAAVNLQRPSAAGLDIRI
jgi:hypothetical protein